MSKTIVASIIVAFGLVVATSLYLYYSPYQECVRAGGYTDLIKIYCAHNSN